MARSPPQITLTSAVVVADRYHLKRQIAVGGMGMVWVAHDDKLSRDVAIKILAKQLASHSDLLTRFEREAKAVAQLRSMHVVEVYDFGIHDKLPFIVMELLDGESLRSRLRRMGTFGLRETLGIADQIAKGLKSAHAAGLIHRDLKPSNVFIALADDVEIVKLLDFGVVKAVDQGGSTDMTASGTLLGTPQYMSPEQVRARRRIDHRSDLWAFGVILFRMLTGLNPFRGESVGDAALRICSDELPKLSDYTDSMPTELDAFFLRAFARDPAARFQTAEELARAFRALCAQALSDVSLNAPQPMGPSRAEGIPIGDGELYRDVGPSVTPPSTSGVSAVSGAFTAEPPTPHSTEQAQVAAAAGGGFVGPSPGPTAIGVGTAPTPSPTPMPTTGLAGPGAEPGPETGATKPYVVAAPATAPGAAAGAPAAAGPNAASTGSYGALASGESSQATTGSAGVSIPGTSLRLAGVADGASPLSTLPGASPWGARVALLKRRIAARPLPWLLGASGVGLVLLTVLIWGVSAGSTSPAGDDGNAERLGRWQIQPLQPYDDAPEVEEHAGIVVDGSAPDPSPQGPTGTGEPAAEATATPPPIKRGTSPPSLGRPNDQRPQWF